MSNSCAIEIGNESLMCDADASWKVDWIDLIRRIGEIVIFTSFSATCLYKYDFHWTEKIF